MIDEPLKILLFDQKSVNHLWDGQASEILGARKDLLEAVAVEIEAYYADHEEARDGYSRLAYYLMNQGALEKAEALFSKDASQKRQSWWQGLRWAECMAALGRLVEAKEKVAQVYEQEPSAVNGFSSLALRVEREQTPAVVLNLLRQDVESERVSSGFRLNIAEIFARHDLLADAEDQICKAYAADRNLRNGYARVGKVLSLQEHCNAEMEWYRRDAEESRLSPSCRLNFAELLVASGDDAEAESQVRLAYQEDSELCNGFARLGKHCRMLGESEKEFAWYERDAELRHLHSSARLAFARLLASRNRWEEATDCVNTAYAESAALFDGYARIGDVALKTGNRQDAYFYYKKDADLRRLGSEKINRFAELAARNNDWERAEAAIERAYEEGTMQGNDCLRLLRFARPEHAVSLFQGYVERGLCNPSEKGFDWNELIERFQRKSELGDASSWISSFKPIEQWDALEQGVFAGVQSEECYAIFDAELVLDNPRDALIQYREMVLHKQYVFDAGKNERPYIIDGGANVGMAIAFFKWRYPDAIIDAFEPNPRLYRICQQNIERNKWTAVRLHQKALLGRDDRAAFHVSKKNPMASGVTERTRNMPQGEESTTIEVETRLLSDFMQDPVDFLKLDIEGAERAVLQEAEHWLHNVKRGFVEYHYGAERGRNELGDVLTILEKGGFEYYLKEPAASSEHPCFTNGPQRRKHWSCSIFIER